MLGMVIATYQANNDSKSYPLKQSTHWIAFFFYLIVFAKSNGVLPLVTPAKAGVQSRVPWDYLSKAWNQSFLDSGVRRNDDIKLPRIGQVPVGCGDPPFRGGTASIEVFSTDAVHFVHHILLFCIATPIMLKP